MKLADDILPLTSADDLRQCFTHLSPAAAELERLPRRRLLDVLDRLGQLWQPGGSYQQQALQLLAGQFSPPVLEAALYNLALALNRRVLEAELQRELGRADLLDAWQTDELGAGHVKGFPLGVVAQVLAGNVFLNGVIGLAQCLLTRNAALLKLSRDESGFTALFVRSLREADDGGPLARAVTVCAWSSSQEEMNQVVRQEADAVVVWGGAAAVAAYPADKCRGRVIHYGPRLGVGFVLDGVELNDALPALAWDVAVWEQRACSSPRLLFVEDHDGSGALPREVARGLSQALGACTTQLTPQPLTLDARAEILSIRELAWWSNGAQVFARPQSMDHTILLLRGLPPDVPVGYRTVLVIPFAGVAQITNMLQPYRDVLQTAVLAAPAECYPEAVAALVGAGVTRIAAAGSASARFLGLPHEGEFALRRLVRLVGVDLGAGPLICPQRPAQAVAAIPGALR
jgi:hypothetical protein